MTPTYDVFLSHNSADEPAVELVTLQLRDEAGVRPFLDKWALVDAEAAVAHWPAESAK